MTVAFCNAQKKQRHWYWCISSIRHSQDINPNFFNFLKRLECIQDTRNAIETTLDINEFTNSQYQENTSKVVQCLLVITFNRKPNWIQNWKISWCKQGHRHNSDKDAWLASVKTFWVDFSKSAGSPLFVSHKHPWDHHSLHLHSLSPAPYCTGGNKIGRRKSQLASPDLEIFARSCNQKVASSFYLT